VLGATGATAERRTITRARRAPPPRRPLATALKKAKKRARHLAKLDSPSAPVAHRLKKMRYTAEFFRTAIRGQTVSAFFASLSRLRICSAL